MTTPSYHQSLALSVVVEDPLFFSTRSYSARITNNIDFYSQEIRNVGGFWSASLKINDSTRRIEDWLENGLGRHLIVYNPYLEIIWEGFVNQANVTLGGQQHSVGPLLEMANRIRMTYSTEDATVEPPMVGGEYPLVTGNNTDSQARYGIIERGFSMPATDETGATQVQTMLLNDPTQVYPPVSDRFSYSGGGPSADIECLGYWHWLDTYYYTNTGVTSYENLSTKIVNVLADNPNSGMFSTDYSRIATNTYQVKKYESGERKALDVLMELRKLGDTSNNSYLMGMYAGRRLVYQVYPTEVAYHRRNQSNKQLVNNLDRVVRPWDMLPGRWVMTPDFLVGRYPPVTSADLGRDPRVSFVETVKFTAPYGVSMSGLKYSNVDQVLAKKGLRSI
jgi:hypothetical protein